MVRRGAATRTVARGEMAAGVRRPHTLCLCSLLLPLVVRAASSFPVFLTADSRVKLGDFGISKALDSEADFAKTVLGQNPRSGTAPEGHTMPVCNQLTRPLSL